MKLPLGIENVLNQPMDRKEFLRTIGMIGAVVMGAGYISKLFENQAVKGTTGTAYGAGLYGGAKTTQ